MQIAKHTFIKVILSVVLTGTLTFLQGQTLLTASLITPGDANILSENCGGPYQLVFRRGADNTTNTQITISDFGVALMGVDYNFPGGASTFTLLAADTILVIPINVINDGSTEGLESLNWGIAIVAGLQTGSITIESGIVDAYDVTILSPADTIIWCRDLPYVLLASSDANIKWSPSSVFDDSIGTSATVRPHEIGWYYASVGSETCGAKDSVYFNLAIVDIVAGIGDPDTAFICLDGPGVELFGSLEGLATDFAWTPTTALSNPDILNPVANPTITTTYLLQSDIGVCTATDRIVVRVDSIPEDLHIDIAVFKPYYCAGEIVALFSPSFDTLDFPDLTFNWTPYEPTFLSDQGLLNAALELQDTTLYIRENINHKCITYDSILIDVVPSSIPLSVPDTTLCPGESFHEMVLAGTNHITDPEWTPEEGLSCTKCLDPNVTVVGTPGSVVSYQFAGKINQCPVGASLVIRIPPIQVINITGDQIVCGGDVVPMTITNPEGLTNIHWSVDFGNASLSCDDCINPDVTINADGVVNLVVTASTDHNEFCGARGFIQLAPGQVLQDNGFVQACLHGTQVVTINPNYTDYNWSVNTGQLSLSCTNCPNPIVTVNSAGRLEYTAEVNEPDVCKVKGLVLVTIFPRDASQILITPDTMDIAQGSNVMATLDDIPLPSSVMWTINGVAIAANTTTIGFNASEEINFISATFINSKGCEQTDTLSLATHPPEYKIPNAFTPDNGDDRNDKFRIIITGNIVLDEFLIFNRWGQLVYKATNDDQTGWDGRFKGQPASSDTYVYSAKLRFPDGHSKAVKGDLILLR
jgi:gliding motility-associated-like protein